MTGEEKDKVIKAALDVSDNDFYNNYKRYAVLIETHESTNAIIGKETMKATSKDRSKIFFIIVPPKKKYASRKVYDILSFRNSGHLRPVKLRNLPYVV